MKSQHQKLKHTSGYVQPVTNNPQLLLFLFLFLFPFYISAQSFSPSEINTWEKQASQVTIIRDNWGIPHVYGQTDADAVFGLIYAQCEDDFNRVEMNYIEKLGRRSEINGEIELKNDLYIRLIIDSAEAVSDYNRSPVWLKKLLNSWAGGINYFLFTHPNTRSALLKRFKPWYPLLWTDGSIGAISTGDITENEVNDFYLLHQPSVARKNDPPAENPAGSNGFAIAPSKTLLGNAILYINPHVTFYFRPEVHMVSNEGLNVYGAVTWGQFFIYQGFNEYCGWMHTSSNVDVSDMYTEKIVKQDDKLFAEYDHKLLPLQEKQIELHYKNGPSMVSRKITVYYTLHGPVMASRNGKWISVKSYNRSLTSLLQSWLRTKTKGLEDFKKIMGLRSNTSNNTIFADAGGNIAYWHGNFVPVRDKMYNWAKPVDGSTSSTEWKGLHSLEDIVHVINPSTGWIQNCNSTPFTVSGTSSPKKEDYPPYMAPDGENYRGINASRLLDSGKNFTLDKIIATGYDTYLAGFRELIPALNRAFVKTSNRRFESLKESVEILTDWDLRCGEHSVATTLAIKWGERLVREMPKSYEENDYPYTDYIKRTTRFLSFVSDSDLLDPLLNVVNELNKKFGTWKVEWGTINRFQRISSNIDQVFNDAQPSIPVGFVSSAWGMLPSYNSQTFNGSLKRYGVNGNSFICAVEFGKRIRARSLLAGGESGDPASSHFNDQMEMYSKGQFKEVLFYREDVLQHMERTYHPGN